MRIVSLVPAATEIAYALGAGEQLVAVTHDCDHPASVRSLPRITRSTIEPGSTSREIDAQVRTAADRGETTFHLDPVALREARPDVLLGQTLCDVCAVTIDPLPSVLNPMPRVVPLDAASVNGIFEDIVRVAIALGREEAGVALIADLRERIARVSDAVSERPRPRVVCLEWLDPLFNAGHWVPEQVALAGGEDVLGRPGERSREVQWSEVQEAHPETLLLMPCGFDAARAELEAAALRSLPGWSDLPAVRAGQVHALDGNAYFSRPGPRIVVGIELLASLLHPGQVRAPSTARALSLPNSG